MENRDDEIGAFIHELMPDATDTERAIARERLDDYIRILMRVAERLERENEEQS